MSQMLPERKEPIIREGLYFIVPLFVAVLFLAAFNMYCTASLLTFLLFFCIWFFRNPDRAISASVETARAIVAPADGRIIKAEEVIENEFFGGPCLKISIFMNVFNVHVNRIPFSGNVQATAYHKGSFLAADLDGASERNERNLICLKTEDGQKIIFVQVAGLIARRIICWLQEGMTVSRGERFGLICFGSRVDLFLPTTVKLNVHVGERVQSGKTIMGWLS